MPLENYRDLSFTGTDVRAGFQFEFYCTKCSRRWKSPFNPYRRGQLSAWVSRFSHLVSGGNGASKASLGLADWGSEGAKQSALQDAQEKAASLFTVCEKCNDAVCTDCWNEREGRCQPCVEREHNHRESAALQAQAELDSNSAPACPNCQTASSGGRFCAQCGFDMASTHKSCPGCGAMALRQARFCTDCGHGF